MWKISVDGCDDGTTIEMELTPDEATLVKRLAAKITKTSKHGCQPTMTVTEITQ